MAAARRRRERGNAVHQLLSFSSSQWMCCQCCCRRRLTQCPAALDTWPTLQMWGMEAFAAPETAFVLTPDGGTLMAQFNSLRQGHGPVCMSMQASSGVMVVHTDSMDVAGEVVQDLAAFLTLHELQVRASAGSCGYSFSRSIDWLWLAGWLHASVCASKWPPHAGWVAVQSARPPGGRL